MLLPLLLLLLLLHAQPGCQLYMTRAWNLFRALAQILLEHICQYSCGASVPHYMLLVPCAYLSLH